MPLPLLRDIITIFGLAITVVFICNRLKIPTIVGFLFTGVVAGPHGLALVKDVDKVDLLAQIGVVLLLFAIGVQFSFKGLMQIRRVVFIGGSVQVALTAAVAFGILVIFRVPVPLAIFLSLILSQSSTAIMLRVFQDRAEVESPHGRAALGIAIFQDITTIPIMLLAPLLAKVGAPAIADGSASSLWHVARGGVLVVAIVGCANWLVPHVLYQINRTRDRELFMFSILFIGLAIAWLTSYFGLSLALGAFIAGLIISESEYSHQTLASIMPFRDVFSSFFFVSVGMLFDVSFFLHHPFMVLALALAVLFAKSVLAALSVLILHYPIRTSILAGVALAEVGEFAFVLSRAGLGFGILPPDVYQFFLGISILTMILVSFYMSLAPYIANSVLKLPLPAWLKGREVVTEAAPAGGSLLEHVIIVGFGINGKNLARAAASAHIPYLILELNPETVRNERAKGQPIYYADASQEAVLEWAGVHRARVLVVAVSDAPATRRVIELARRMNPRLYVIARTRFVQEMAALQRLGADDVVPEDFETSVEIFTRVLVRYLVPRDQIDRFISEVRADGYKMLRTTAPEASFAPCLAVHIPEHEIASLRISPESPGVNRSLAQLDLRRKYGVTVLAIRRSSEVLSNPHGEVTLSEDDVVVVLGRPTEIAGVATLFQRVAAT